MAYFCQSQFLTKVFLRNPFLNFIYFCCTLMNYRMANNTIFVFDSDMNAAANSPINDFQKNE